VSQSEVVVFAWKYGFNAESCVIAGNACHTQCYDTHSWWNYPYDFEYAAALNIKENIENIYGTGPKIYGAGVNLNDMLSKGYRPQPIMLGAVVLVYGYVNWGTRITYETNGGGTTSAADEETCNCPIVWFIDEQNAFDGECREGDHSSPFPHHLQSLSDLPQRNVMSAGMFFGINDNANRV
jgi:hypothetical protein